MNDLKLTTSSWDAVICVEIPAPSTAARAPADGSPRATLPDAFRWKQVGPAPVRTILSDPPARRCVGRRNWRHRGAAPDRRARVQFRRESPWAPEAATAVRRADCAPASLARYRGA